jgi:branched-subunit amino acid ABC-type transport system permease component
MDSTKSPLKSLTIGGGITAIAGVVAAKFGYTVTPDDMAQLTNDIGLLAAAIGGLLAIIGRLRATKKVAMTAPPAPPTEETGAWS